ncbi:hypothetical protein ACOTDT_32770 [Achromobacter xylosoxidans]
MTDLSRKVWTTENNNLDYINAGSLQRIAARIPRRTAGHRSQRRHTDQQGTGPMTQQDDITQRVLTDDEINDLCGWRASNTTMRAENDRALAREVEFALLSKLRAPVADERAAFEAWALTEFTHPFMVPDPLIEDPDGSGDYVNRDVQMAWAGFQQACAALASAPVAGEAQPVIHQHGFASDNQKLRAINESLDEQLEEVMAERDDYHDWADELSEAIAAHLGVEIGEHSSSNLPWLRALDAIKNAAPQASAEDALTAPADVAQLVAFIFDRFGQPGDAGALPDNVAAAVRRLERGSKAQADKDGGQQRACTCHPDDRPAGDCQKQYAATDCQQRAALSAPQAEQGERDA